MTATQTWRNLLTDLLSEGVEVSQESPGANFRGRTSSELLAHRTVWPMSRAVVLCPERRLGYKFLAAEAAWILSGSNRLGEIAPFAKNLRELSDDGVHLYGAYGPPFREQLPYVLETLTRDGQSRQAVSTIWRPRPGPWKDVPCTIALQYLIRPERVDLGPYPDTALHRHDNVLHCVASMRSSDAWLGVPYDIHTFSMTAAYVALLLRDRVGPLRLGNLYLTAGSQHLYLMDREPAERCAWEAVEPRDVTPNLPRGIGAVQLGKGDNAITEIVVDEDASSGYSGRTKRTNEAFELAPIDLARFNKPDDLIDHLWAVARQSAFVRDGWLSETIR